MHTHAQAERYYIKSGMALEAVDMYSRAGWCEGRHTHTHHTHTYTYKHCVCHVLMRVADLPATYRWLKQ